MSKIRKTARLILWSASLALLSLLTAGALRAQEIRPIAEPNQSVKMGTGWVRVRGSAHAYSDRRYRKLDL